VQSLVGIRVDGRGLIIGLSLGSVVDILSIQIIGICVFLCSNNIINADHKKTIFARIAIKNCKAVLGYGLNGYYYYLYHPGYELGLAQELSRKVRL
jgi:hypothetical protein